MAVTSLVAQALILIFLSEAHSHKLSTLGIGIVLAASGAGGGVGSIFSRFLPEGIGGLWLPIQMVAWSVALALLAMGGGLSVFWSAFAMLILGATGALGNIEYGSYVMSSVADDMIAKVTGFGQVLAIGGAALGPVFSGVTLQRYGAQDAIESLLVIVMLLVLVSLLTPEVAKKMSEIHHFFSHDLPSARPAPVISHEMIAASGKREETAGISLYGEAPDSTRECEGQNRDMKGEFCRASSAVSRWRKIVDHARLFTERR
jgi:hypothetical protein